MNTLILSGLVIGYLLIGIFIFSIVETVTDGEIDSFWIMLLWPLFIIACILSGIILGVFKAGEFIGDTITDKLN